MGHTYPAHGWLPEGAHFALQRSDQGRDFVTNWQGVIQAPGDGVCTEVRADRPFPNGFGPHYPIVRITSGSFAKGAPGAPADFTGEWYIGHCTSRVNVGDHFHFGAPLAVADQGKDFNGTHGGWVELGTKMANGLLGPNSSTGHWFDALLRQPLIKGVGPVTGPIAIVDTPSSSFAQIPHDFWSQRRVAGYTTQKHLTDSSAWTEDQFARFPHCIRIDQAQSTGMARNALVKDVEAGGARIADAVVIAQARHAAGLPFTIYVQDSNLQACRAAMRAAGLPNGYVTYWVANWNLNRAQATERLSGDVVAVQWASPTSNPHTVLPGSTLTLKEANADLSVSAPAWPGVAPAHA